MKSSFVEASFLVAEHEAEPCSEALLEVGALSVSVEDADASSPDEQPLFGEPGTEPSTHAWRNSVLVALFDGGDDPSKTIADAIAHVRDAGIALPLPQAIRPVDDQDWVRATQAQFAPINIGRLWVVPSWHEAPAGAELVLRLDPGMAFGTGTHPTTRLCLAWLERELAHGASVLDYGCGSGILAIAAAKLGAGMVEGVDIDAHAVEAARENALRNDVTATFRNADNFHARQRYDAVVANILSNPLKLLAPALIAHVAPGGALVLSGVLERQAIEVASVYESHGLPLQIASAEDGWVCLSGRFNDSAMRGAA
ncbi:MAG TPA: 50S ribosomal protein L11 methyltransferase [Burkholderiaceae bacterium]|nr:50S ribosomal protein L11 methyltransferase [Burkholderiaceae bacterium]